MRLLSLTLSILTLAAGCQAVRPHAASPMPATELQRLPIAQTSPEQVSPPEKATLPRTVEPTSAVLAVAFEDSLPEIGPERLPATGTESLPATSPDAFVPGAMTLGDLEHIALQTNPSIARASALVRAAQGNWVQAGLPPNPNVGYEVQQLGSGGLAEQHGIFVGQEFVRGGKLKLSREVAAQEWARAEHDFAAQQQRVLTDVRVSFYQVLIAQKQEEVSNELVRVAREGLKVADALKRGKEVGRIDVVQAQLEAENSEILAQNARNRRLAAWQGLSAVIGNPNFPPQPLQGNLNEASSELTWESSLQRLLTSSPEIAAAMANVQRTRWAVQRAQVEKTPNVSVNGLFIWRDNGIGGGSDGNLTVGVPLPIWNRNQGGVTQAQGEAAAAERALQQLELSLQSRLAPIFERYANALQQTNRYREKILPAAQESLSLSRQLYQAGETPYLSLLTAQRTYSQTNLNYLESLRELRSSEAEIQGLLLSNSLETR